MREAAGKPALDGSRKQAEGGLLQVLERQAWVRVALLPCRETDDDLSARFFSSRRLAAHDALVWVKLLLCRRTINQRFDVRSLWVKLL